MTNTGGLLRIAVVVLLALVAATAGLAADDAKALVAVVNDPHADAKARVAAAEKLAEMGPGAAFAAEAMGDALVGGKGREWNHVPAELHGPALLAPILARLGEPGMAQLRRALRTQNPEAIVCAAWALAPLGAKAALAVPDLLVALDYRPDEYLLRVHWHPWQPFAWKVEPTVLAALGAIGPAAKDAIPKLREMIVPPADPDRRGGDGPTAALLALAAISPEDPAPSADVLAAVQAGHVRIADPHLAALDPWFAKLGAAAVPLLTHLVDMRFSAGAIDRLAAMGAPAHAALVSRLRNPAALRGPWEGVLDAMTRHRCFPAAAAPVVAEHYLRGLSSGGEKSCVPWLAGAGEAAEAAAFDVLRDYAWNSVQWNLLRAMRPEFGERLSRRWLAAHAAAFDAWRTDAAGPARTRLIGGPGGSAFTATGDGVLVGIDVGRGSLNWRSIVRSVAPVFRRDDELVAGPRHGAKNVKPHRLVAKEGYAVGGLLVAEADARVAGLAVVFLRVKDAETGRLDPSDGYLSPWIGRPGDDPASPSAPLVLLGGDGRRVAGLVGRAGADIDALGLVAAD